MKEIGPIPSKLWPFENTSVHPIPDPPKNVVFIVQIFDKTVKIC